MHLSYIDDFCETYSWSLMLYIDYVFKRNNKHIRFEGQLPYVIVSTFIINKTKLTADAFFNDGLKSNS